jgi:hypothetical protein
MGEVCNANEEMRSVHKILVGKPEGQRQLGRPGIILKYILLK